MNLKIIFTCIFCFLSVFVGNIHAGVGDKYPTLKTTDGSTYEGCTVTKLEPDGITIMHGSGMTKLPFTRLPADIQQKYNYDQAEAEKYATEKAAKQQEALEAKRKADAEAAEAKKAQEKASAEPAKEVAAPSEAAKPTPKKYTYAPYEPTLKKALEPSLRITMKVTDGFSFSQLEEAKKKATELHRPLGFVMVWDKFFDGKAVTPSKDGSNAAMAHFYYVFKDQVVLVFVSHERELGLVPDAVKKGFFGPEEGGFAPNMAVTDSQAEVYICEIPYGGRESNGAVRTEVFREGFKKIRAAQAAWDEAEVEGKKPFELPATPSGGVLPPAN